MLLILRGFEGFDEAVEERVDGEGAGFELGVGLGGDEETIPGALDEFDKGFVGRSAGDDEAALFDSL